MRAASSAGTCALMSTLQPVLERSDRRPVHPASSCTPADRLARTLTEAEVASRTCHTQRRDADVCRPTCGTSCCSHVQL